MRFFISAPPRREYRLSDCSQIRTLRTFAMAPVAPGSDWGSASAAHGARPRWQTEDRHVTWQLAGTTGIFFGAVCSFRRTSPAPSTGGVSAPLRGRVAALAPFSDHGPLLGNPYDIFVVDRRCCPPGHLRQSPRRKPSWSPDPGEGNCASEQPPEIWSGSGVPGNIVTDGCRVYQPPSGCGRWDLSRNRLTSSPIRRDMQWDVRLTVRKWEVASCDITLLLDTLSCPAPCNYVSCLRQFSDPIGRDMMRNLDEWQEMPTAKSQRNKSFGLTMM
jgi:hypothetical protein